MIALRPVPESPEEPKVHPNQEIFFPKGLPGFSHLRQFHLMTDPEYSPPFELLVSDEDPEVGFYLVDPTLIRRDYAPDLPAAEIIELEADEAAELLLRAVLTLGSEAASTTANLAAPLVLNLANGRGCQAILEDSRYSMHTPITAPAE